MERPKISRPMWNALKAHIIRERQRKKQGLCSFNLSLYDDNKLVLRSKIGFIYYA